jgi:Chemotaxis phosphatase CheX
MSETNAINGLEQFVEALETMAFISPMPSAPVPAPASPRLVRIECAFPKKGMVTLAADESFGALLASNLLACDPTSAEALAAADDALRELVNITCGAVIRHIGPGAQQCLQMSLPTVEPIDAARWEAFVNAAGVQVLDADGHSLAFATDGMEAA